MTKFESKIVIPASSHEVYNFLSDYNNHEKLQPEHIQNWSSSTENASFSIQNWATITLRIQQRTPESEIQISAAGQPPFPLTINWRLEDLGTHQTQVALVLQAELNMMLKMMASGPLQKLVEIQTEKLKALFS